MNKILIILFCLYSLSILGQEQGSPTCDGAVPMCAGGDFEYPNISTGQTAENGPDYGCLDTVPNPAWFYMIINQGGNLTFTITQTTTGFSNSDVDFILWGPFDTDDEFCNDLTSSNTVDCSYSGSNIETVNILNANPGEKYILLVTNYSNEPGFYTVEQTAGSGSTNCDIVLGNAYYACETDGDQVEQWDLDAIMLDAVDGDTSIITTAHLTYEEAETETNPLGSSYENTSNPNKLYLKAKKNNGEYSIIEIQLIVSEQPELTSTTLIGCRDNSTTFDLSEAYQDMLGGDITGWEFSAHNSEIEAQNDENPLNENHTVSEDSSVVYIRVDNPTSGCYAVEKLFLEVSGTEAQNAQISKCILGQTGSTEFDLTEANITTETNVTLSYHLTLDAANNNLEPISSPYTNTANPQVIYVRVQNPEMCFSVVELELIVNETPALNTASLELCAEDLNGYATFDLTTANISTNTNYALSYHHTAEGAETNADLVADNTAYYTMSDSVWARAEDLNTGCVNTVEITLIANLLPVVNPVELSVCDFENNGSSIFVLTDADDNLTSETNVTISYYQNYNDAENKTNPLENTYENTHNGQVIFSRVEFNDTLCFSIAEVTLLVKNNDLISLSLEICDKSMNDGFESFDLTNADAQILAGYTGETVKYYATEADVIAEENPLNSIYTNTVNPQVIYGKVSGNSCRIANIILTVYDTPILDLEDSLIVCVDQDGDPSNNQPIGIDLDAGAGYTYLWSGNSIDGATTQTVHVTNGGIYSVLVSNASGCSQEHSFTVSESSEPVIVSVMKNLDSITINVTGKGIYEYSIDGINWQATNTFSYMKPGIYDVSVRDNQGCGIASTEKSVIGIPNVFTPNGDGYNDLWTIQYATEFKGATIQLFDRYGKKLISGLLNDFVWDGKYQSNALPATDYWYIITFEDHTQSKGSVTLIR